MMCKWYQLHGKLIKWLSYSTCMEYCYSPVNVWNDSIFPKSVELLINIFWRSNICTIANLTNRNKWFHTFIQNSLFYRLSHNAIQIWMLTGLCEELLSIYCSLNWYQTLYILNHFLMCWVIDADILFIQRLAPNYSSYPVMDLHITRGVIISIKTCLSCNITRFEKKRHALTICT